MELNEAVSLWLAYRRWKRQKRRENRMYLVHPILHDRMTHSMFETLYPKLRQHEKKVFNYFRMSVKSFDDLLLLIGEDLLPRANYVPREDVVSPEQKLVITLSMRLNITIKQCHGFGRDVGACWKSKDSTIFKNSTFFKKLTEKSLNIPGPKPVSEIRTTRLPHVIVGDEAFSLSEHIMRPYCGKNLTKEKRIFNYRLSRARRYIECCFGILVNKWRIFHKPLNEHIEFAENIIKACCVLHNYVRLRDGYRYEDTLFETALDGLSTTTIRPGVRSRYTRDIFADYFMKEGRLSWQEKMI
ncbi:unnamed protein product [Acanthoscelides obtectus]|uniref:DDE Tnp4 domain-containing protein n=1 Tax=Acanthoscelides obtectus TaxID=200917 RepID=A0A9P0K8V3_ACAOB|nr:unnamed protein product [Acanthoscelides obtectus]CAK1662497.1 Protein ALP1-like [Acanthoscelides obtectus]